jgi:hypothetical protein
VRITKFILTLLIPAVLSPVAVRAQEPPQKIKSGWHNFWHEVDLHRRRVAYWPEPFVLPDRELVRQPFRTMVDNGWVLETTLVDAMFDGETQELTYGGRQKVRWIMLEAPPHRRHVFVLEAATPDATAARLDSVQRWIAEIAPGAAPNCISTTNIAPRGGSGYYLDEIQDAYRQTVPSPRLPPAVSGGGGFNSTAIFGNGGSNGSQ